MAYSTKSMLYIIALGQNKTQEKWNVHGL